MSNHKQNPTSISQHPDAEDMKKSTELSEEELEMVTGGREGSTPSISEITITKPIDKTSAN